MTPNDGTGTPGVAAAAHSETVAAAVRDAETAAVVPAEAPQAILVGLLSPLLELNLECLCSLPCVMGCSSFSQA